MGLQDIIITPIYFILFCAIAYFLRPFVTNKDTRKYFMPALVVRFIGAIGVGVLYQYYYGDGDTYSYFHYGSQWIWKAFLDNPIDGFRLLTKSGPEHIPDLFKYSQHIFLYHDPKSYFIIAITTVFDLFTFHTYSATALFFSVFSFSGIWAMFSEVQKRYKHRTRWLAYGILFFPSVVFWGSGILKDTLTIGALGWFTWGLLRWIEADRKSVLELVVIVLSAGLIFFVKEYIIIAFFPLVFIWLFFKNMKRIKSVIVRIVVFPLLFLIFFMLGYAVLDQLSKNNTKYRLDKVVERSRITAYDIRYGWGTRGGDSDGGYDIGFPDGSLESMLGLIVPAINVSLFRPYIWEVKNPLMLLSALESLVVLILTVRMFFGGNLRRIIEDPFLIFCLVFSLLFAFAVGASTFNFGTLMRYKIPMLPFFATLILAPFPVSKKQKSTNLMFP